MWLGDHSAEKPARSVISPPVWTKAWPSLACARRLVSGVDPLSATSTALEPCPLARTLIDGDHLPAFDGVGRHFGAMGGQVAMDDKLLDDTAGLHAEGLRRKLHVHALDQRVADRAVRRHAFVDHDRSYGLAHLYADRAI